MNHVSNRQIFFIIILAAIASPMTVNLPAQVVKTAGTGGWSAILISGTLFILPLLAVIALGKKFPHLPFRDYVGKIVGKPMGNVISLFYSTFFVLILAYLTQNCARFISDEYLPRTPFWVISLALVIIFTYASHKGAANISRLFELLGLVILLLAVIINALVFISGTKSFLTPFFQTSCIPAYFSLSLSLSPIFFPLAILLSCPMKNTNSGGLRAGFWGLLVAVLLLIFFTLSTLCIFGPNEVLLYPNVLFASIRESRSINLQILSRMDFIFIICWFFSIFCLGSIIKHGIDGNLPKPRTILSAILVFGLSLVNFDYSYIVNISGIIAAIVLPLLLFLISKSRKTLSSVMILLLALPLSGCWDAHDIQNRSIVTALFADKTRMEYQIVMEIADVVGKPEGEVDKSVISGTGSTWAAAFADLDARSSHALYPNAIHAIVLGKSLCKDNTALAELLVFLRKNDQYRKNTPTFAFDEDNIKKIAEAEPINSIFVGTWLEKTVANLAMDGRTSVSLLKLSQGASVADLPTISIKEGVISCK